jgi:ubiquinone/menaquinone biosynthesis C-methylase UbiE
MPSLSVIKILIREMFTMGQCQRKNEPDLVMDDPDKVAAYVRAGCEDGVMAPVYLYHCAQICDIIRPGDTVVDLACGPATQIAMVARLNPESQFIGVDLSSKMLDRARRYCHEQGLNNIEFCLHDISDLSIFDNNSIDVITSTVALHHLPNIITLEQTFVEINRILTVNGGLYLVDFGHLKSEKSIHDFAYQYADRQAELFTLDYLYSLQAAFSLNDFQQLTKKHLQEASIYSTFFMPFMVVIKSLSRRDDDAIILEKLCQLRNNMPEYHQKDLSDLMTFFRLGGLKNRFLK